jgi:CBS domain-containing protein
MRIEHVLEQKGSRVETLWNTKSLRDAVAVLDARNIASIVITDPHGVPLGIVTDRDIIRALARRGAIAMEDRITQAMATPLPVCALQDTVSDVLRAMTNNRYRHAVVLHGGQLAGVVSIGDLVKVRLDDAELEGRVLRERALGQMAFER